MNLLIDIGHPAHVHLFKHVAFAVIANGGRVLFSVREKAENVQLLRAYNLPYTVYGRSASSIFSKIGTYIAKMLSLSMIVRSFKPHITVSHSSFYLSQISWLFGIPNITLEDTGNLEQVYSYLPFTSCILTPKSYHRFHGKKHFRYDGFHETAYIHHSLSLSPQNNVVINPRIILIRLVDWNASHDIGHIGLKENTIDSIISSFQNNFEIRILSDRQLPNHLKPFSLSLKPIELHEYLLRVKLYIGEGASLATECALLGVPTIYINSRTAGVISAQYEAGLLYHFISDQGLISLAHRLLLNPDINFMHRERAMLFLKDKVNLSNFLFWFLNSYPGSKSVMRSNPNYLNRFK